jgi:hypothetical protein
MINHPTEISPVAAYNSLILALRRFEKLLGAAVEVQFEAPPGGSRDESPSGISNPTLDTVIDLRRFSLSRSVTESSAWAIVAAEQITELANDLERSIDRWQG